MSIIRIGLAETENFAEGWEAIFGNKKKKEPKAEEAKAEKTPAKKKAKKAKKK